MQALSALPWDSDTGVWAGLKPRTFKHSRSRWTFCIELAGRHVVVKRYLVDRPLRGWISMFWRSKSRWELRVSRYLYDSGFPTPEPLAGVELWRGWKLVASYFVSTLIEGSQNMSEWLHAHPGSWEDQCFLREVGTTVARLHDAGIAHEDCSAYNLLVNGVPASGAIRLTVLDLDGGRIRRRLSLKERSKNLRQLARSLQRNGLTLPPVAWEQMVAAYVEATNVDDRSLAERAVERIDVSLDRDVGGA